MPVIRLWGVRSPQWARFVATPDESGASGHTALTQPAESESRSEPTWQNHQTAPRHGRTRTPLSNLRTGPDPEALPRPAMAMGEARAAGGPVEQRNPMLNATSGAVAAGPETNHELPSSGLAPGPGRRRPRVLLPRSGADSQAPIGAAWCQWPTSTQCCSGLACAGHWQWLPVLRAAVLKACASARAPGRPRARAVTDGPGPCVEVAMQTPGGADQGHGAAAGLRARDAACARTAVTAPLGKATWASLSYYSVNSVTFDMSE